MASETTEVREDAVTLADVLETIATADRIGAVLERAMARDVVTVKVAQMAKRHARWRAQLAEMAERMHGGGQPFA